MQLIELKKGRKKYNRILLLKINNMQIPYPDRPKTVVDKNKIIVVEEGMQESSVFSHAV